MKEVKRIVEEFDGKVVELMILKQKKANEEKGANKMKEFFNKNKDKMKKALVVGVSAVAVVAGGVLVYGLAKSKDEESNDLGLEDTNELLGLDLMEVNFEEVDNGNEPDEILTVNETDLFS